MTSSTALSPPQIVTVTLNPAIDQTVSVPNFAADAVNRVDWAQADPGGKGINVSSFLADYGLASTATGFLGHDNAASFEQLFQQKEIADRCLRLPGPTRVNIKIVDDAQQQVTDLNFPGLSPSKGNLQTLMETLQHLAETHDWFVLAGSLPAGVPVTVYHDLTQWLKQQGKRVVLDSSGAALAAAIAAAPTMIKPNLAELQDLLNTPLTTEPAIIRAARSLIDQGIERVVVSMGADGALFVEANTAVHAQPSPVTVKSTVGAGDAMVAGTLAAWLQAQPLADCARLGTAFSMGALTQLGPRLPSRDEILTHRSKVTLRPAEVDATALSH